MRYERLEHTADSLIKAHGSTLEECFENAAYAMFDQMVDVRKVEVKESVKIKAGGEDLDELLVNFLSELLYVFDTKKLVLSEFKVSIKGNELTCAAGGEHLDLKKHSPKTEIKAVTYHMLSVDVDEPSATVLFDI
ncbi:MAG: archease [Methanomassiliicoccales archaeon]|nr:archease [Methanomassiliicoccales archaeon]